MSQPSSTVQLGQILGSSAGQFAAVEIDRLSQDSREVNPGTLFVAMPGHDHDGREYIGHAVERGAVAVLAETPVAGFAHDCPVPLVEVSDLAHHLGVISARFFGNPSAAISMAGITGTNGKTTVSRLIGQLARAEGHSAGVIGTLGAVLDDGVEAVANTTPDPISLQSKLASWRQQGIGLVAMEVSSHALVQGRVNGVEFNVAVLTNLSRDHLDYHGDMASYASAKSRLFQMPGLQWAVVNHDDPFSKQLRTVLDPQVQVLTYSATGDAEADLRVLELEFGADGFTAQIASPWGQGRVTCLLPGRFNVDNLLAALAASSCLGCDWGSLLTAVPSLHPVPGRMQSLSGPSGQHVVVDYAHTPDALASALKSLRSQVAGKLFCVVGCGGDRDTGKRAEMGRMACKYADEVVITSDNPRSEPPAKIIAQVLEGCTGAFLAVEDRAEAIHAAVAMAGPTDCVLIAGKGHERYQLIGGQRLPFSDVEQAQLALAERAVQ